MSASIPTFHTARLTLRAITLADAPSYQRHFADWQVIRNLTPRVPWPYPQDGAADYIQTQIIPQQGKDKWV